MATNLTRLGLGGYSQKRYPVKSQKTIPTITVGQAINSPKVIITARSSFIPSFAQSIVTLRIISYHLTKTLQSTQSAIVNRISTFTRSLASIGSQSLSMLRSPSKYVTLAEGYILSIIRATTNSPLVFSSGLVFTSLKTTGKSKKLSSLSSTVMYKTPSYSPFSFGVMETISIKNIISRVSSTTISVLSSIIKIGSPSPLAFAIGENSILSRSISSTQSIISTTLIYVAKTTAKFGSLISIQISSITRYISTLINLTESNVLVVLLSRCKSILLSCVEVVSNSTIYTSQLIISLINTQYSNLVRYISTAISTALSQVALLSNLIITKLTKFSISQVVQAAAFAGFINLLRLNFSSSERFSLDLSRGYVISLVISQLISISRLITSTLSIVQVSFITYAKSIALVFQDLANSCILSTTSFVNKLLRLSLTSKLSLSRSISKISATVSLVRQIAFKSFDRVYFTFNSLIVSYLTTFNRGLEIQNQILSTLGLLTNKIILIIEECYLISNKVITILITCMIKTFSIKIIK